MKSHKPLRCCTAVSLALLLSLAACGGPANSAVDPSSDASVGSGTSQSSGDVSGADVSGVSISGGDSSGGEAEPPADDTGEAAGAPSGDGSEAGFVDQADLGADDEAIHKEASAMAASPPAAVSTVLKPQASGTAVEENGKAVIDYSNTKDGYIMIKFTGTTSKTIKVKVAGQTVNGQSVDGTTNEYVYNLPANGQWQTFPLPCGNGEYTVKVLENTEDNKYAVVLTKTISVTLTDEFAPFIRPNQYVNYENASKTIAKAAELIGNETDVLAKVQRVYEYVVKGLTYDTRKAETVQAGYLPVLDSVLAAKTGICFDYAALMAGMLRCQGVPCKLVVGYVSVGCHAWLSVYSPETGWIENTVYFDGKTWQRMDPTFASSSNNSPEILQYIGDGANYDAKYFY